MTRRELVVLVLLAVCVGLVVAGIAAHDTGLALIAAGVLGAGLVVVAGLEPPQRGR